MARTPSKRPPTTGPIRIEYQALSELRNAPRNPKKHDQPGIAASMSRFGYTEPPLIDETTGALVAGHGRVESLLARKALGEAPPTGIMESGGDWMVPVVRGVAFASAIEAEAYLAASNRLTESGGWDEPALVSLLRDVAKSTDGLLGTGFSDRDLRLLMNDQHSRPEVNEDDSGIDRAEELQKKWKVQRGQLWLAGAHRIYCGDCREPAGQALLMDGKRARLGAHDPPYGLQIAEKLKGEGKPKGKGWTGRGKFTAIAGDSEPFEPSHLLDTADIVLLWGANHYANKLPASAAWVVWDKRDKLESNQFSDCELAWVSQGNSVRIIRHMWNGFTRASEKGPGNERVHPTQKPVAVIAELIETYTKPGELVCDWYGGSGSTLRAAERTKRVAYVMDIEPKYVAVHLERMSVLGILPVLDAS